jgi:hypothetical protein
VVGVHPCYLLIHTTHYNQPTECYAFLRVGCMVVLVSVCATCYALPTYTLLPMDGCIGVSVHALVLAAIYTYSNNHTTEEQRMLPTAMDGCAMLVCVSCTTYSYIHNHHRTCYQRGATILFLLVGVVWSCACGSTCYHMHYRMYECMSAWYMLCYLLPLCITTSTSR